MLCSRYTYEPYSQSTNDYPESELPILAGDYVLVWGEMDEDGYLEAELMDGRRGLVPSNYITKLVGEDLMEFHQSMVIGTSGIAGQGEIADDGWSTSIPQVSDDNVKDLRWIVSGRLINKLLKTLTEAQNIVQFQTILISHKNPKEAIRILGAEKVVSLRDMIEQERFLSATWLSVETSSNNFLHNTGITKCAFVTPDVYKDGFCSCCLLWKF